MAKADGLLWGNLDALWDCLRDSLATLYIDVHGIDLLSAEMREYAPSVA